jgi:hypothetical protein
VPAQAEKVNADDFHTPSGNRTRVSPVAGEPVRIRVEHILEGWKKKRTYPQRQRDTTRREDHREEGNKQQKMDKLSLEEKMTDKQVIVCVCVA